MRSALFRALRIGACCLLALLARVDGLAQEQLTLVVPGAPWTLTFPKADFEMESSAVSPDGRKGHLMASDKRSGLNVSFFVEPAEKCKSSRECRDMVQNVGLARLGTVENVAAFEIDDVSVVECFVAEFKGMPVKQQNLFAEFVAQGYWVDMHVSKVNSTEEDCGLLERLVKTVAFVSKEAR